MTTGETFIVLLRCILLVVQIEPTPAAQKKQLATEKNP